ncbi:hypothetical protein CANCADRAFT_87007 [Tortispora caseinolytica NRRL Y-17796]|uniref:SET domain-containing protein n=1 Tax=Tortispora caseinolytica NRRL Y-17796 TaxID=767744 RepID=A0A1E4TL16_9ASCO|nr:hypothetical protein CANCADRAFT_87007 [Tortispora caseinolytica NRRL Y-17796]
MDNEGLKTLIEWGRQYGAIIEDDFYVVQDTKGSGVCSRRPIKGGVQPMISCPRELAVTCESMKDVLIDAPADLSEYLIARAGFCVHVILNDRNKGSKWGAYIDTLPRSFDTPMYYSETELAWLKGTTIYNSVPDYLQMWKDEYERMLPLVPEEYKDDYTFDLFKWVCTVFTSRAFPSRLVFEERDHSESYPVLLPLLDIFNHAEKIRITWKCLPGSICLVPESDIPEDKEIFNNYGAKSNEEFLMGYGFVIPANAYSHATFKLGGYDSKQGEKHPALAKVYHLQKQDPRLPASLIDALIDLETPGFDVDNDRRRFVVAVNMARILAMRYLGIHVADDEEINKYSDSSRFQNARWYCEEQRTIIKDALVNVLKDTIGWEAPSECEDVRELCALFGKYVMSRGYSLMSFMGSKNGVVEFAVNEMPGFDTIDSIIEAGWEDQILLLAIVYEAYSDNVAVGRSYDLKDVLESFDAINDPEGFGAQIMKEVVSPFSEYNAEIFDEKIFTAGRLNAAGALMDRMSISLEDFGYSCVVVV